LLLSHVVVFGNEYEEKKWKTEVLEMARGNNGKVEQIKEESGRRLRCILSSSPSTKVCVREGDIAVYREINKGF